MSQAEARQGAAEESPIGAAEPYDVPPPGGDWLLQALLNLMSSMRFSADLTLLCGGALVSGTPVSERAYFEALGVAFKTGLDQEGHPNFASEVETWLADWGDALQDEVAGAQSLIDHPRSYVNLKQVTIQVGSETVTYDLWRGRLADVSGWHLGRVGS